MDSVEPAERVEPVDPVDIVVPHVSPTHVVEASLSLPAELSPEPADVGVCDVAVPLEEDAPVVPEVTGDGPPLLEPCGIMSTQTPARPPPENSA